MDSVCLMPCCPCCPKKTQYKDENKSFFPYLLLFFKMWLCVDNTWYKEVFMDLYLQEIMHPKKKNSALEKRVERQIDDF